MKRLAGRLVVAVGVAVSLGGAGSALAAASVGRPLTVDEMRCVRVTQAVDALGQTFEVRRDTSAAAVNDIAARLADIIGRADARGYDVRRLQADQAELQRRAYGLTAAYGVVVTAVSQARGQCGAAGSLATARAKLAAVRMDVQGLTAWQQTTLEPDLWALKTARHR